MTSVQFKTFHNVVLPLIIYEAFIWNRNIALIDIFLVWTTQIRSSQISNENVYIKYGFIAQCADALSQPCMRWDCYSTVSAPSNDAS